MPHLPHCLARPFPRSGPRGRSRSIIAATLALGMAAGPAAAQTAIVTYHNDESRTGWNQTETILTPASVGTPGPGGTFGLLQTVPLDGTVDAQPLVVPNVVIANDPNPNPHDVVYVATQNNSVYAIDPTTGYVLLKQNFGPVVKFPRGCGVEDVGLGITGTPVIDVGQHMLYVVAYTHDTQVGGGTKQTYRLHALDLSTLQDAIPPVVITGSQTLTSGASLAFAPGIEKQRPALLEYNGEIYTAFGSFCDNPAARGWVFGWSATTLKPMVTGKGGVPLGDLTNRLATSPGRFLAGIWMSNAGLAADSTGIYYVTGNSAYGGVSYDPVNNVEESVVRISLNTKSVRDIFTPMNLDEMDIHDSDFGSGGVVLVPNTSTAQPPMAAAAGKLGILYLLNRTKLGGYTPGGPDKVLDEVKIGECWCTPAYFNDGTPTIVSSGGKRVMLWQVESSPTTTLKQRAVAPYLSSGPDPGFFTSVSSNGTEDTMVWAVTRPLSADDTRVWLYGYSVPKKGPGLKQVYVGVAGSWGQVDHDADIVPVVANGRVYVASDAGLEVFGLGATASGDLK